jgi:hypothetical protein
MGDDMTLREAKDLCRKIFGDQGNLFEQDGTLYVGKFTDRPHRPGTEPAPNWRPQEIFGAGKTFREAFRFHLGAERIYSYTGAPTSPAAARGMTPVVDRYGRIRGWESPAGLFSTHFPGLPAALPVAPLVAG